MLRNLLSSKLLFICLAFCIGCQSEQPVTKSKPIDENTKNEPRRVMVQHCLISFQGLDVPGVTRTKEEAQALAEKLFAEAKAGADFNQIVKQYTDDTSLGIYKLVNSGLPVDVASGSNSRDGMVKGFGDVSFSLKVDEYGLCPYDPATSKFGWHIIKRLE
ncbi:MAG: peptidyl-prolyl cis-trans isomerase [Pirellula sp.]|jgi:hypothetical protein|nr:peptidyl-prolyl cis-trans isomerase [Pirellula sp.]